MPSAPITGGTYINIIWIVARVMVLPVQLQAGVSMFNIGEGQGKTVYYVYLFASFINQTHHLPSNRALQILDNFIKVQYWLFTYWD